MRLPLQRFLRILAILLAALPAPRAASGGVTLVTHGFSGNIDGWVISMANQIPGYPGFEGSNFSCYEIVITSGSGGLVASANLIGGVPGNASDSGEIFIKLDWSSRAGLFGGSSSTQVAAAAVAAMLSPDLIPELGGHALAELPLHLIGHSRGSSVVGEMTRLFGAQGVWVDHLTLLDPVDNYGSDGTIAAWENVLFGDDYWQNIGGFLVPTGKPIAGFYNRHLTNLSGANSSAHSDVHLWYHGTVDLETPASDTEATITSAERDAWWVAAEAEGSEAGFRYSLLGRGDRLSPAQPLGSGTDAINDGYNQAWDLGAGLAPNRTALPANSGLWPNLIRANLATASPVTAGQPIDLPLHHQSGATPSGGATLHIYLDPDRNPWNGNEIPIHQLLLPHTGTAAVAQTTPTLTIPATVPPGTYAVLARLTDGPQSRTLHTPEPIQVLAPPRIDPQTVRLEDGLARFTILGAIGQTITLLASDDLRTWTPLATETLTTPTWDFTDPDTATFPARCYLAVPAP